MFCRPGERSGRQLCSDALSKRFQCGRFGRHASMRPKRLSSPARNDMEMQVGDGLACSAAIELHDRDAIRLQRRAYRDSNLLCRSHARDQTVIG